MGKMGKMGKMDKTDKMEKTWGRKWGKSRRRGGLI